MVRCPFIFSSYINGRGLHPLTPTPLTGMPCYHTAYSGKFYSIHLRPLGRGYTPWVRPSALGSGLRPLGRGYTPWVGPSALGERSEPHRYFVWTYLKIYQIFCIESYTKNTVYDPIPRLLYMTLYQDYCI